MDNSEDMRPPPDPHYRHRFPAEIISHAVWLYHVFSLSLRDVELLLASGDQGSAETGLIRLVLIPEVDADQPPLLFQTDHPIDLGVGTQVAISWSPKPHSKRNMVALRQLTCCQKVMPEFGKAIGREGRNAYARTSLSSEGVDHESRYGTRTGILGR